MNKSAHQEVDRLHEAAHLKVMRLLQANEQLTQREIASELGISLGKVNYLLQGLAAKGWIKANNFRNSQNKWGYLYQLTPSGLEQKARITLRYLQRRMVEYESLKAEIAQLERDVRQSNDEASRSSPIIFPSK